ncbi:MAG: hypothetical protein ACOYNY_01750 [Caldilineaceae bacterium]
MDEQPQRTLGWIYQIQVEGHLNLTWSAWFEELTLTHEADGSTIVTGNIVDQATLHGMLNKVRDLGLTLISVQRIKLILSSAII